MHYNKKINILKVDRIEDALGGHTDTTSVLHLDLPCRINWTSGRQILIVKDKLTTYRDAKIFCRYIAGITPAQNRVQYGDNVYQILSVFDPDEMHRFMVMEVKRIN